ncbi:DUF3800 domain-containing protein [Psychroflexus salis]|uniref:DUF3800 domain-containing protein n=1 Tax=Psychroflexus salis TaxID=1526574 RepID=A0A917A0Z2_9FLAO|nr:DUF3800 domain-containing protein [Psychroflexus salis]GGE21597.1 hypothetical protein GCM10010831_23310 [Psychroflexus salis]
MHILYVDESGDPGKHKYSSPHFILSGLIIAQDDWSLCLSNLKTFRKSVYTKYGLNQRTEIHASELIRINNLKKYQAIRKTNRINILKDYASQIPMIFCNSKIINICLKVEEFPEADIFELAWSRLLQRYDTYLKKDAKDKGLVIIDDTDSIKLQNLQRKMRVYNPIPSHYDNGSYNAPINNILEDPFSRNSNQSYFIQTVDVIAHLLYRKEFPKGSLKKYGLEYQFNKFEPILLKRASKEDSLGIVRK